MSRNSSKKAPSSKDYEIGYGKPPKQHQFPKGKSACPGGGRKRRSETPASFNDALVDALLETVTVTRSGRKQKIPKVQYIAEDTVNQLCQSDLRTRLQFFRQMISTNLREDLDRKMNNGEIPDRKLSNLAPEHDALWERVKSACKDSSSQF